MPGGPVRMIVHLTNGRPPGKEKTRPWSKCSRSTRPPLGDRSYLVHDGEVALVVDPQRDIDRILDLAAGAGRADHPRVRDPHPQRLRHRRAALARATGAAYHVNADDPVAFDRTAGQRRRRDRGRRRCGCGPWPPPGTPSPTCPTRSRRRRRTGGGWRRVHRRVAAVRLHRPPGPARPRRTPTRSPAPVRLGPPARRRTARRRRGLPTHGFGSFCSATQSDAASSTIGQEKLINPALTRDEEPTWTSCSPAWTPGPPTTPTWPRPTSPARPGPTCPRRVGRRRRAPPAHRGGRVGGRPA